MWYYIKMVFREYKGYKNWITPAEAAKAIAVSRENIFKLIREGKLKAHKGGSGKRSQWRILKLDFEDFKETYKQRGPYKPRTKE